MSGLGSSLVTTGALFLSAALIVPMRVSGAGEKPQAPTIAEKTAGRKLAWIFNLSGMPEQGRRWLVIDKWGERISLP